MRKHVIRWLCGLFLLLTFLLGPLVSKSLMAPAQPVVTGAHKAESIGKLSREETPAVLGTLANAEALVDSAALIAVVAAAVSGD